MISFQKNFLFIHVPKTGGNSIQKTLIKYSEDNIICNESQHDGNDYFEIANDKYQISKHSTLMHYKSVLSPSVFRRLYKFTIIRNPWDRMISYYFSPHRKVTAWNIKAFLLLVNSVRPVSYYSVQKNKFEILRKYKKLRNLSKIIVKSIDFDVDFVLRYENLQNDFDLLCSKLDIPKVQLPVLNKSQHQHYSHYYDSKLIKVVRNKFWEEIEFGNYEFEAE